MPSKIEWTDETWNPVTGCTKVSQGCKNCYAERLAPKVFAGQTTITKDFESRKRVFTDVVTHPERLDAPLHWKRQRRVFVNSMSDLFQEDVPDDFIDHVFAIMARAEWHSFQVLTKRPQRMLDYISNGGGEHLDAAITDGNWPLPNVWLGVSVEDQATADERIPLLLQTPAAVRFLSCEPLLGPIDFMRHERRTRHDRHRISWVIAGGESGPNARPSHPDWFRSLRDQCAAAAVPYFFKQWGEWWPIGQMPNGYLDEENNNPKPRDSCVIQLDGRVEFDFPQGAMSCYKVGKKAAGRMLDGREHMEWPA